MESLGQPIVRASAFCRLEPEMISRERLVCHFRLKRTSTSCVQARRVRLTLFECRAAALAILSMCPRAGLEELCAIKSPPRSNGTGDRWRIFAELPPHYQ